MATGSADGLSANDLNLMTEKEEPEHRAGNGAGRTATVPRPSASVPVVSPGSGMAPGARLAGAFASAETFPVSVDARDRAMSAGALTNPGEMIAALQADLGLAMAVIRAACRAARGTGGVGSLAKAVQVLKPSGVLATVAGLPVFDPLSPAERQDLGSQRVRAHAQATQLAMAEICQQARVEDPAEAAIAALMHDIGRLIIVRLHPDYDPESEFAGRTPEQRIRAEKERYGIDHALAGGLLARRWDLPNRIAVAIERHHNESATGLAATVALADQIAHFRAGDAVSLERLTRLSESVELDEPGMRTILAGRVNVDPALDASTEPCPLSERERDALLKLSEGKVYKQIAEELDLSVSTVRTHLHNIYRKLEVVDRAQAVIKAREHGWV